MMNAGNCRASSIILFTNGLVYILIYSNMPEADLDCVHIFLSDFVSLLSLFESSH